MYRGKKLCLESMVGDNMIYDLNYREIEKFCIFEGMSLYIMVSYRVI
jgi:hypothetical protein